MTENKRVTPSTWADPDDAPELREDFFQRADLYEGGKLLRRGRPVQATHKQPVTLRLDPQALAQWRATGKGWQTRAAQVLADWAKAHPAA